MPKENLDPAFAKPLAEKEWSPNAMANGPTPTSKYTPFKYLKNEQQTTVNPFAPITGHATATPLAPLRTARKKTLPRSMLSMLPKNLSKNKDRKRVSSASAPAAKSSKELLESFKASRAGTRRLVLRRQVDVADINTILDSVSLNDSKPLSLESSTRNVQSAATRSEPVKAAGISVKVTSPPSSPKLWPSSDRPDYRPPFLDLGFLDESESEDEDDDDEAMEIDD